jgi:hypothetical protein
MLGKVQERPYDLEMEWMRTPVGTSLMSNAQYRKESLLQEDILYCSQ